MKKGICHSTNKKIEKERGDFYEKKGKEKKKKKKGRLRRLPQRKEKKRGEKK